MCKVHDNVRLHALSSGWGTFPKCHPRLHSAITSSETPPPPPTPRPIILRMPPPKLDFFFFESRAILKTGPRPIECGYNLKQMEDQIALNVFPFFFFLKISSKCQFFFAENLHITCQKTCFSKCLRGRKGK